MAGMRKMETGCSSSGTSVGGKKKLGGYTGRSRGDEGMFREGRKARGRVRKSSMALEKRVAGR